MRTGAKGRRRGNARLHRLRAKRFDHGQPISRIDLRPTAIFLVAIVAFFVTFQKIPVHAFYIDLYDGVSVAAWDPDARGDMRIDPEGEVVTIRISEDDRLFLNGRVVSQSELQESLYELQSLEPVPMVEFEPDANASYDLTVRALHAVKVSGTAFFRFASMEEHCQFGDGWDGWTAIDQPRGSSLNIAHALTPIEGSYPSPMAEKSSEHYTIPDPVIDRYFEIEGVRPCGAH